MRRYEARGNVVKNRPGEGLFKLTIAEVTDWISRDGRLHALSLAPLLPLVGGADRASARRARGAHVELGGGAAPGLTAST